MKPFLATPAYSGSLTVEYVGALLATLADLGGRGITSDWRALPGLCYVDMARDRLAAEFLASDCTDLVFLDDDVGFPADGVARLLSYDRAVVGGVYPKKADKLQWPVGIFGTEDGTPLVDPATGLIACAHLPTGFLRIRRDALERMVLAFPERAYTDDDKRELFDLFSVERADGRKWGEDVRFCNLARSIGIELWCLPDLTLTHTGRKSWSGNFHDWLRREPGGDLS